MPQPLAPGVWSNSYVIGDFIWTAIDYIGEASIGANGYYKPDLRACGGYCPQGWKCVQGRLVAVGRTCFVVRPTTPAQLTPSLLSGSYYISFCGDLDLVGMRKPQSYYRSVLWNNSALELGVHAPSTTGQAVRV